MTFTLENPRPPRAGGKAKRPRADWAACEWGELLAAVDHDLPGARQAARRRVNAVGDAARRAVMTKEVAEHLALARSRRAAWRAKEARRG